MTIDGVFVHHLINELKGQLINQRINKVSLIDNQSFLFNIQGKKELFFSLNSDISHIRLSHEEYVSSSKVFPLFTILKKYFESSIITNIEQIENDRIVKITVASFNDLGFVSTIYLILEFFGRNANLFILDENEIIIDCLKKTYVLLEDENRINIPKAKYNYPISDKINPFKTTIIDEVNNFQGTSKLTYSEIIYRNDISFIHNEVKPQIINVNNKIFFSCFDLHHLSGEITYFNSLSEVLENYYSNLKNVSILNSDQKLIENYIKKELTKVKNKIVKQEQEKLQAIKNLDLERIGNLLSANLYLLKKNMDKIQVHDFYNNNELITISVNPLLSPSQNLNQIFTKYKKAKRTLDIIDEQLIASNNEIEYLNTLQEQLKIAKAHEIKEIIEELGLIKENKKGKKKQKPQLTVYHDKFDNIIWVGKNNVQNNYLTHELANYNDYFFHVKGAPGSHTILRCNKLTDEAIILAANIAAMYSKSKNSSNVAVDYTLVRNVKKVPKMKGSFVTYTNYKTAFVTPDINFIKSNTI